MSKLQKVILEKGVVSTPEERSGVVTRFKEYEEKLKNRSDVKMYLKSTPIDLEDKDMLNMIGDRNVVELLDGCVGNFIMTLNNPYNFRFDDEYVFNCYMKSKYVIYVEFDLDKYLGELEEKYEDFSMYLDD